MTISGTVRLAAIGYQSGFKIDDLLRRVTGRLRADHIRLGGTLQENTGGGAGLCSAMTLIDLASQRRKGLERLLQLLSQFCFARAH